MRAKFPVTVHLLFFRGSQILLLRRFNTGFEDGNYSVPAGHLDGDEPVRMAAVREALEEIGVCINVDDIAFATVTHRKSDDTLLPLSGTGAGTGERVDFFVHIKTWSGEPFNAEPDKCDELRWCDVHSLPDNTIPYVKQAIHNYMKDIPFEEFGWDN
jgi:8-oxo-dGTP diphosphatase